MTTRPAIYAVEHEAKALGIVRTSAHLKLPQTKGKLAVAAFKTFLDEEKNKPRLQKGPTQKAINYALNQWPTLTIFLDNILIPLDNNAAESALRRIEIGRKNWLFVGNADSGQNLVILMTLIKSCQAVDVNPQDYLTDVLPRVSTHPAARIDELLPDNWKLLHASG